MRAQGRRPTAELSRSERRPGHPGPGPPSPYFESTCVISRTPSFVAPDRCISSRAIERRIDQRERLRSGNDVDAAGTEQLAALARIDLQRPRGRRFPRLRLRIGGGHGRVETHIAFDLLNHLMDMAVEHGDR